MAPVVKNVDHASEEMKLFTDHALDLFDIHWVQVIDGDTVNFDLSPEDKDRLIHLAEAHGYELKVDYSPSRSVDVADVSFH